MGSRTPVKKYKRTQWLVNPPLQYQFIGILLSVMLVLTVGALGSVYFALWLALKTYGMTDNPVAVAQLTTVGLMVTLELLILAPFVIWLGLRMTHRVAGPLVRILASVQQMSLGNFDQHINLRKGDSLVELADAINTLSEFLRRKKS